jgi:hypothetical protein
MRLVVNLGNLSRESSLDLRADSFLTPYFNFAAYIFGGDDAVDNGKAKTGTSLKGVFLREWVEELILCKKLVKNAAFRIKFCHTFKKLWLIPLPVSKTANSTLTLSGGSSSDAGNWRKMT